MTIIGGLGMTEELKTRMDRVAFYARAHVGSFGAMEKYKQNEEDINALQYALLPSSAPANSEALGSYFIEEDYCDCEGWCVFKRIDSDAVKFICSCSTEDTAETIRQALAPGVDVDMEAVYSAMDKAFNLGKNHDDGLCIDDTQIGIEWAIDHLANRNMLKTQESK